MEIVSIVSILGLVGIIVYMQYQHSKAIIQLKTIEKAKDVQEVKQYVLSPESKPAKEVTEIPLKDIDEVDQEDLDKIINSVNGNR